MINSSADTRESAAENETRACIKFITQIRMFCVPNDQSTCETDSEMLRHRNSAGLPFTSINLEYLKSFALNSIKFSAKIARDSMLSLIRFTKL